MYVCRAIKIPVNSFSLGVKRVSNESACRKPAGGRYQGVAGVCGKSALEEGKYAEMRIEVGLGGR